jgi:hypothetical protein
MPGDTGARDGTLAVLLAQLERAEQRAEAERRRNEQLLTGHALTLGLINQRLAAIEAALTNGRENGSNPSHWHPSQWVKILVGLSLPIAALLLALSGNIDQAKRLLAP